jgi:hypothetical protein
MRKMSLYALLLCGICLFGACGKDGDAGPKGDTGAAGPAGPAGPKGDAGEGGAGIVYSDWLDVSYVPVKEETDENDNGKLDTLYLAAQINAPKLTDEILSTGDVKVFLNLGSADDKEIVALPYTIPFNGPSITPSYLVGKIMLIADIQASTGTDDAGVKYLQYRYVLIPGSEEARKAAGIDWNDYNQVKAYLKLKD